MGLKIRKMTLLDFFTMKRLVNDRPDIVDGFGNLVVGGIGSATDRVKRLYETVNIFLSLVSPRLALSKYVVFLALDKGIVGLLFLVPDKREANLGVFVERRSRGAGVGRKLMERAFEWSRENDKALKLCVWEHNDVALVMYKRMGFRPEKRLIFMAKKSGVSK